MKRGIGVGASFDRLRTSGMTRGILVVAVLAALLVACAAPPSTQPRSAQPGGAEPASSGKSKTLVIGVLSAIQGFAFSNPGTPIGGWLSLNDIHTQGLITSEFDNRNPTGRLAERVPTLDDGSIVMLPDGGMRVEYKLRPGITWHDGAPFTARDLVFTHTVWNDRGLPSRDRGVFDVIGSVDAPDDLTFLMMLTTPYYLAGTLGGDLFWPLPEHLLRPAYERYLASKNADDFLTLPYWSSAYVNLGPFRVASFAAGELVTFEAYPNFFLGRPKLDTIEVRALADQNALFSNLLAGSVQMFLNVTFEPALGAQLRDLWTANGEGTVLSPPGYTRFMTPQWRADLQREPTVLDVRVRGAMYQALDRESISDVVQAGRRDLVAYAILPPPDRLYEGTRDGLRRYAYDPGRARALLQEVGWTPGPDGAIRYSPDGRRFQTAVWANARWASETGAIADFWRQVGMEVEEYLKPASVTGDRELRARFPGWDTTSRFGDAFIIQFLEAPAGPDNRWTGNAYGYFDPRLKGLVEIYQRSLTQQEQLDSVRRLTEFVGAELPVLPMYYEADYVGARKGVKAFDDIKGGAGSSAPYGLFSRNAHLWSIE